MSESRIKQERAQYRDKQTQTQAMQQQAELQRKIDFINSSHLKMQGLRGKEAWRSFLFLRGEIKKFVRQWQEEVNQPTLDEKARLYKMGCIYGAKVMFQISQNVIDMKKDIDTGKHNNGLNFFKGGNK